jgi:lysyl-tRNA synthetase, class II
VARRLVRASELTLVALLATLTIVAATGWLYVWQPRWGTPMVNDALPLDELSRHSSVPLLQFLLVWGLAGAVLGVLANAAQIERLTAALLFGVGAGAILYATTGVSFFVVRQVPAGEAFHASLRVSAVYLAAAFAGLGGALLGRAHRGVARRAPVVLAAFVALSGVLDIASAVTPAIASRLQAIEDATPNVVPKIASALVVPAGLTLIVLARGLWRRRRRAWQLTVAFVFAAAALHILKGLDYEEAAANVLLGLALVARRRDFAGRGDPQMRVHILGRAAAYAAGIFAYGAAALWINRAVADRPYSFGFVAHELLDSLALLNLRGSSHLAGRFGDWFPYSVLLLGLLAALSLLWLWLAPWRYRLTQHARELALAHRLVTAFGEDTLAPFALRADKSYFFSEDERAFLAYTVVASVAVVSGDPVGADDAIEPLLRRFLQFAHERDWRIAVLGVCEQHAELYRRLGLHVIYHGDEAIVDTAGFSLEGRAIRKVRQSVSRLERGGYRVDVRYAGDVDEDLRAELEEIAALWRGDEPVRGFTMELDNLFRLDGRDALFVIGRDGTGAPAGFLHFAVSRPGSALSLSSMPRLRSTPNGFNEWLVVETLNWARAHYFAHVSLNFAPFAALFNSGAALSRWQRLQRRALESLKFHFQLDSLLAFNDKFFPHWEHRYVVFESLADLPRVGLAGLAAEGYLPLPRSHA